MDWKQIEVEYRTIYLNYARTHQQAQGMLNLIPQLSVAFDPDEVTPAISHATLCLRPKASVVQICLWYDPPDQYQIYLWNPSESGYDDERITVKASEVLSTLTLYLNKVRENSYHKV